MTTTARPAPTAETHPFRVGSMVYPTRVAALAAMARATETRPEDRFRLRFFSGSIVVGPDAAVAEAGIVTEGEDVR